MSLPHYPEYKESGVAWLGEVPAHWEVLAIKRLSAVQRGASPRPIDDQKYFDLMRGKPRPSGRGQERGRQRRPLGG